MLCSINGREPFKYFINCDFQYSLILLGHIIRRGQSSVQSEQREIASIVFKLEGAKKCWEFRIQKNPEKFKEQKSLKKEEIDEEKISKMVFVTTVIFWLGTLAQGYENLPDFMLDKYLNSDE